jgi:ABC-type bacteriocin/lantibiotic exporter with double-glycine peptidase domain
LDKIYDVLTSVEKLAKITECETETEGSHIVSTSDKGLSIQFKNVEYCYDKGNPVLQKLNFNIPSGQTVCIYGKSGSGKTTVLRLLTGAYKSFDGALLLDDMPIANYNLESLRSVTGILLNTQDIFQGSLMENLTMGNQDIDKEELTELVKMCGLTEFIQSLPNGYDTVLLTAGTRLPARIKQTILLIRALLGKRRLLLLEEPFNNLEVRDRAKILELIQKETTSTVIIASTDKELAKTCNYIIHLENGVILEQGPSSEIGPRLS